MRLTLPTGRLDAADLLGDAAGKESETMDEVLGEEFFRLRHEDLARRVSARRLRHVEGVVRAASMLARVYGVSVEQARLAALLHDWDKSYDDDGIRSRVVELGLEEDVDPWTVAHAPATLHGITAAAALARDFPAVPPAVLQAISRHTTGAVDMSALDMVVYIADCIDETRTFGRVDEVRRLVGEVDLEELFFQTYRYWVLLLFEREKPVHPATIDVWNAYAARRAARKGKQRDR